MKVYVRKNGTVIAVSSRDKGKTGGVLKVVPKISKVVIRGVNLAKKHQKLSRQNMQGRIIETEAVINSSKVVLFCGKCKKAARINHKLLEDGAEVGVYKKYEGTF